jgi:PAS domain S-box-containing protein
VRHDIKLKAGTGPEREALEMPFATSPHPMWILDRGTDVFLDVNDVAVQQYGYSRQEFLTMTILDIRPTTDIPELLRQTPDPRPKGPSTAEKWRHQAKNGTVFPVAITSWDLTFHGRQAELVLARREGPVDSRQSVSMSSSFPSGPALPPKTPLELNTAAVRRMQLRIAQELMGTEAHA